jgi:hypothetical protein
MYIPRQAHLWGYIAKSMIGKNHSKITIKIDFLKYTLQSIILYY